MKDLVISGAILEELRISPSELMIDLAVYLYDMERLTMGQAKKLAGLTQIKFQKEMSERDARKDSPHLRSATNTAKLTRLKVANKGQNSVKDLV